MTFNERYFQSKEFQELLRNYESSTASGGSLFLDVDDLVDIADYYNYIGEGDKALELVEQGLEFYPNDVLLNVFMARKALLDSDYEQAKHFADTIDDKESPDYHYLVAEIMIAQGHTEKADEYLRPLFVKTPADEVREFVKDVGNLFLDYAVFDKAYEWMMRIADDNSDDFKELMGRALIGVGRYQEAEQLFNELLDRYPYSQAYWAALASAQYMSEDFESAITSSEFALAIDPKHLASLSYKANSLMKMGNDEEALRFFKRFEDISPDDPSNLLNMGGCLMNLRRYEEALDKLQKGLDNIDETIEEDREAILPIFQEMVFCHCLNHHTDKALELLDKASERHCNPLDLLILRGHVHLQRGELEEAQNVYVQAIELANADPSIYLRIATSLYDNRYVQASYMLLKKFMKYDEQSLTEGYSYMALFCWDLKLWNEFAIYLHKAMKFNKKEDIRLVLSCLVPEELPVEEYETYLLEQIKNMKH